jgi:hypothetical protein
MWEHAIWDRGYEWWRNALQGAGAAIGIGAALLLHRGALLFILIGAIYGTLLAGLSYQLRGIVRGDRAKALLLFSGYLGAAAGFTYFFFLSGTDCGIERLLFSPLYAGVGGVVGAAVGWAASRI